MAKIVEHRSIPLEDLVIGKGQARTHDLDKGIDELANSIKVLGLLQPIVVCQSKQSGKWEILSGQRRYLAHRILKMDAITAAVMDERVGEAEAKAISITENLIRRRLTGPELKDGILFLYNRYGTVKDVARATGISEQRVRENVYYQRLLPELKKMVDDREIDIGVALRANDAASAGDAENPDPKIAVALAAEMKQMTNVQQRKFTKEIKQNPDEPLEEAIEKATTGANVTQVVVTLTEDVHRAVRKYAEDEKTNQDAAIATLIEEGLVERGLLEGEE